MCTCSSIDDGSEQTLSSAERRRRMAAARARDSVDVDNHAHQTEGTRLMSPSVRLENLISKRRRTVYLLYLIALLDLLAVSLFLPRINEEISALGASHFVTGLIGSAYGAIQFFSSPFMGRSSDKYGPKLVMFVCLILTSVAYVIQGTSYNVILMLASRSIAGVFKHTQTIGKSIVSELSPMEKSYVIANFNAFGTMGFILGPTIGTYLMRQENGFQLISYLSAIIFLLNAVILLLFVPRDLGAKAKSAPQDEDLSKDEGESKTIRNADVHTIIFLVVRFLFSFATLQFREFLGFVLKEKFGPDAVDIGHLSSIQAFVSTITGFGVGPINAYIFRRNSLFMVLINGIFKTCALFTLFYTSDYNVALFMLVSINVINPFLRTGVTAISLEGHDSEIRMILGMGQSATSLARMASPAVAGFAVSISIDGPFLVSAVSSLCTIIIVLIAQRYAYKSKRVKKD